MPYMLMVPIFIGLWIFGWVKRRVARVCSSALSLSTDAGIGVEPVLSCGNDVGGVERYELDEEVVDKPGTTIGT